MRMDPEDNRPLLPHEDESLAEASAADVRPPPDRWATWHASAERPAREGGCWLTTLDSLRYSRYVGLTAAGLLVVTLLVRPLVPPNRGGTEDGLVFVFALTALIGLALEVLALPLARLERAYAEPRLAAAIAAVAGRKMRAATLVGLVHDGRPEWPPGSFADSYAFLQIRPGALRLWRLAGELMIPREAVLGLDRAVYMAARGHDVPVGESCTPLIRYVSSDGGARKVLALEALAGPSTKEVSEASRNLYDALASWFASGDASGNAIGETE